jgi:hypothetical protein
MEPLPLLTESYSLLVVMQWFGLLWCLLCLWRAGSQPLGSVCGRIYHLATVGNAAVVRAGVCWQLVECVEGAATGVFGAGHTP